MKKRISLCAAIALLANVWFGSGVSFKEWNGSAAYAASEFGFSTVPASGAANVDVSSPMKLSFDRQVAPQAGEISFTVQGQGAPSLTIPVGSSGLVGSSNAYELKLAQGQRLQHNTAYTVSIPKGLFKDSAGSESAAMSLTITTAPEINPALQIVKLSPASGERAEASQLDQLVLELNGQVQQGGGAIKLVSAADNSVVQQFKLNNTDSAVQLTVDNASTKVSLKLGNKLPAGGSFYVLIEAGALKDADNRVFAGISGGDQWSFSTKGAAAVQVTEAPKNNTGGVATTTGIQLNFDRPMLPAAGTIIISPGNPEDGRAKRVDVNSPVVKGGGTSTISINPASAADPLLAGTVYTVMIPKGAFYDQDGNRFPANEPFSWSFTTASASGPLTVAALSPQDRSESVDPAKPLSLVFNREVKYTGGADGIGLFKNSGTKVPVSVQTGSSAKEIILKPAAPLDSDTLYYVDIPGNAFVDAKDPLTAFGGLSGKVSWSFRTAALDKTAPQLTGVQLENNRNIRLKYDETLNSSVGLLTSSFTVTVNEEKRAIDSVSISGNSVLVTLNTGVAVGQVVKISYSGGLRTIKDASGNEAATFSGKEVANGIQSVLPVPKYGTVSGTTLTLTFNDNIKSTSSYAYDQFVVTSDGYSLGVTGISFGGSTVNLYLSSAPGNGTAVRVSYYPGSYPLQDPYGQNIAGFNDFFVRNTYDTVAPVLNTASGSGNKIILTYNEGMATTGLPLKSQFSVLVGGSPNYVTDVNVSGSQVILTLQSNLSGNQNVTVSYVPGSAGLSDLNGNRAGYLDLQPVEVSGVAAVQGLQSASVYGSELTLVFARSMQTATPLSVSQFAVRADGTAISVKAVSLTGDMLKLTLSTAVKPDQKVDLSYMADSAPLKDATGTALPSFSMITVQNVTGSSGTGTTTAAGRPSYLGTLAQEEFGKMYGLLQTGSATAAEDRSMYSSSIKRYVLNAEHLKASYAYLHGQGTSALAFEVPSTERAAYVVVPYKPLSEAYARNAATEFAVRFGDKLYSLPVQKIDLSSFVTTLGGGEYSLIFRIEAHPTGTYTPLEQKLAQQGMQFATELTDYRLSAMAGENYTTVMEVKAPTDLRIRTNKTLNNDQTAAARLDALYSDAAYLPTSITKQGNYTLIKARMQGNQVAAALTTNRSFTDTAGHWGQSIISKLASKNIIDSSYGTQFKPNQKITRSEFAVMLARGFGLAGSRENAQRFRDVTPSTQTGDYIGAAAKAGIITGNTDATFRPNDPITREQMAIMMVRALDYAEQPVTLNAFADAVLSKFKDKAKIQNPDIVAKATQAGIIQGVPLNKFLPQGNATRAEGAAMLQRMLEKAGYL